MGLEERQWRVVLSLLKVGNPVPQRVYRSMKCELSVRQ